MKVIELADELMTGYPSPGDSITAAVELRRLAAVEADCAPYLKEGETPAERVKRALGDADSLMSLYLDVLAERDALKAELERINALEPVAWMYDRAGSAFNPQFLPAGPNADQRRNGIVSEGVVILNPDSACKNWQPLIALGSKT